MLLSSKLKTATDTFLPGNSQRVLCVFALSMQQNESLPARFGRFIKNTVFGNWDRGLNSVSLFLSVISLVISVAFLKAPDKIPDYIAYRDIAVVISLLLATIVSIGLYYKKDHEVVLQELKTQYHVKEVEEKLKYIQEKYDNELEKAKGFLLNQLHSPYTMVFNYRSELVRHFKPVILPPHSLDLQEREFDLFRDICRFLSDLVRTSLLDHFRSRGINIGEDVSVAIKLVLPSEKIVELYELDEIQTQQVRARGQWVVTAFRDTYTYTNYRNVREVGAKIYDIRENSAFRNIVENGRSYFLHNDLKGLRNSYLNESPDWNQYYNSTLVVPIQYQDDRSLQRVCHGFVAADSKNAIPLELYNDKECLYILNHAADLMATFFLSLALYYHIPNQHNSMGRTS